MSQPIDDRHLVTDECVTSGAPSRGAEVEAVVVSYVQGDEAVNVSEESLPRHRRATSGYFSAGRAGLAAARQRVMSTAERVFASLSRHASRESLASGDSGDSVVVPRHTDYVTVRERQQQDRRGHDVLSTVRQPSIARQPSIVRHHSESSPAVTEHHLPTDRLPSVEPQHPASSSAVAVDPQYVHYKPARRQLLYDVVEGEAEVDNVSEHQYAVMVANRRSKAKSDRTVEVRNKFAQVQLSEVEVSEAESVCSVETKISSKLSASSIESGSEAVGRSVSVRAAAVKDKSKVDRSKSVDVRHRRQKIISDRSASKAVSCAVAANTDLESSESDNNSAVEMQKVKRSKRRVVESQSVSKPKKGSGRVKQLVHESDSESDDKHSVLKRQAYIKPEKFDGVTPTFATFKAHFENASKFNAWNAAEQLAFLKSSLTGSAAQCLWDQSPECTDSLEKLWKLLGDRFAGHNLTEKYRTELRNRRRKPGESLDALCQDIRRLLIYAYPGPTSSAHEAIAKDSFIDALSVELSLKVRERDPSTLDSALNIAMRLEAIQQSAAVRESSDDNTRPRGKTARGVVTDNTVQQNVVMEKLNELQSRFGSDLRALGDRLHNVESTMRCQSTEQSQEPRRVRPPATRSWSTPTQSSTPTSGTSGQPRDAPSSTFDRQTPSRPQRSCFACGDPSHLKRNCPKINGVNYVSEQQRSSHNGNSTRSAPRFNRGGGSAPAAMRGSHGHLDNGSVYLPVCVNGRRHLALLDSGCELSLAPQFLINDQRLRSSSQQVFAANGSPIQVLGETCLEFEIGGRTSFATVLVSPDVSELMLGITWLTEHHGVWDFGARTLYMDELVLPLHSKKTGSVCRRVYVQENLVLGPRQQVDVPVRSTVNNVRVTESDSWLLESKQIRPGVLAARTLLPDQHRGIAVRVVNTTTEPQALNSDVFLGNLEPVDVCAEDNVDTCSVTDECAVSSLSESDPVKEMLEALPDELSDEQRSAVEQLLSRYSDVFSKGEFDIGCTNLIQHRIDTADSRPVRQPLRRHPMAYLDAIDEYVEQLQQNDVIEPSCGPWCSNIVVVRKKDGRLRLCVDYRAVNAHTYQDSYPLPNIEATLDALSGSSYFCTLDLRSGYHNVTIAEEDRDKTQFITRRGTFRWKRMPFGLTSAPGTFQRLMDLVMCGLSYESVLVYLDDLIIMATSFEQLLERFEEVLRRLRAAKLKLNHRKCSLFQRKVSFLGHVISASGVEVQPEKTEVVRNWAVPRNLSELRSFLGLASYYRRFIEGFSVVAAPLYQLLRKGVQFHWNEQQQIAFDELKLRLSSSPVLASPRSEGTYILDSDASDYGLGVVLSQMQDGVERVLAFASRSLSSPERNYSITRKELLAVIFGLKRFRQYLIGRKFIVRTDHSALQWLRRTPEPIAQAGRWLAIMEEFDFSVQHRAGNKHLNADALSRRPSSPCGEAEDTVGNAAVNSAEQAAVRAARRGSDNDPDYRPYTVAVEPPETGDDCPTGRRVWHVHAPAELADLQQNDSDIGPFVKLRLEYNEQPPFDVIRDQSPNTKILWAQWPRLVVREGVVYRVVFDRSGKPDGYQLLVPTSLRKDLIDFIHSGLTGSHVGIGKTMSQLARRAWWCGWRGDVRRHLRRCPPCSRYHRGALPRHGPLQPTRVGAVFERLSIDLTGPHPRSKRGNVYILTAVCAFSKFCECIPLRNKEAVTVARALVEQVFCRYGTPLALLSDRGGEVDGQIMREVCRLLQIDKLRTTAYHPSCNATCERMHRTLNSLLGKVVSERQTDWDEHLPYVAAALRASPSESTSYSANMLMFGREVNTPADIAYCLSTPGPQPNYDDFVEGVRTKLTEAYELVRVNLGAAALRNKRYYDMKARPETYSVGDLVYYFNPRKFSNRSEKWARKYTGPFRVVKVLSPVNLVLQRNRGKTFVTHVDKVKYCYEDDPERCQEQVEQSGDAGPSKVSEESTFQRPRRVVRPPPRFIAQC